MPIVNPSFLLIIGAALLATPRALGQTALGTGNALDNNLGVGTGGFNLPTPTSNFRDRNLVVTGDVIGGRGFRGSVGYTAESDFRGSLGSNDLFNFRAGSAMSSAPYFQMGTTYERLRFGQDIGIVEYRRSGSGAPESVNAQNPIAVGGAVNDRLRLDRRIVSSTLALSPQQFVEPRVVGVGYNDQGAMYIFNSSPIRGLTAEYSGDSALMVGFTTYDMARVRQDVVEGRMPEMLGTPFRTQFNLIREPESPGEEPASAVDTQQDTRTGPTRIDANVPADYREMLQRVAERYAKAENVDLEVAPDLIENLGNEYQELRLQLMGRQRGGQDQPENVAVRSPDQPSTQSSEQPPAQATRPDPLMPQTPPGRDPITGLPNEPAAAQTPASIEFATALRHDQQIRTLTGPSKDRFNELMATAEQKLREGEYFLAERSFERALRFAPGHPLATAGMAHAQIGAGLYLSASLTLRNLFTIQPEMIDATYTEGLLPRADRLAAAVAGITRRMDDPESADRASYGFLLAYIGHQTADTALIDQGLAAFEAGDPKSELLALIRTIWQPAQTDQPGQTQPSE